MSSGTTLVDALVQQGVVIDTSVARRLIIQGAIGVNGIKIRRVDFKLFPDRDYEIIAGKSRRFRVLAAGHYAQQFVDEGALYGRD